MSDRYAVFGNPVEHSLSPAIHSAFAAETGQDLCYDRQRVAEGAFAEAVRAFFAAGGRGLNVTLPFKIEALACADELSPRARLAGAVNTLIRGEDGRLLGENTDGAGLVRDLTDNLGWPLRGRRVLLLGAGGAARGVLAPLLDCGPAEVCIANRTAARASQLARDFAGLGAVRGIGFEALTAQRPDLIVNATSASLAGALPPLPDALPGPDTACYDMMYGPAETVFLRWAAGRGLARRADGLGMLVEQAAESFRLWRGVAPATLPVIAALRGQLGAGVQD